MAQSINALQEAAGAARALDNKIILGAGKNERIRQRLSVQIDLTSFPVRPYRYSLAAINSDLLGMIA